MIRDLECGESVIPDPVDSRTVEWLQGHFHCVLEPGFLSQMSACHGGRPGINRFVAGSREESIGQFLTLVDDDTELVPPFRPHFDYTESDERVIDNICFPVDGGHSTGAALFSGLLPFATTRVGYCSYRASVDLVCLDYRAQTDTPPVVLWLAERALSALLGLENLPVSEQFDEKGEYRSVPWDDFLVPVSPNFDEFVCSLSKP